MLNVPSRSWIACYTWYRFLLRTQLYGRTPIFQTLWKTLKGQRQVENWQDIKNNAWVTVNNDILGHECGDLPMIFTSDEVTSENQWQNRFTSDPKIVIHGNECIILFLTRYFMSWTLNSAKNNYRSLISPLLLRTVFSDLVFWRHHRWPVTSNKRRVLALWRHIRRLLLHAQIGAKAIFTSE